MTTKKKCYELAALHGIEIYIHKNGFYGYESDLSLPEGYQLEEYDGARKGLNLSGIETAKDLWVQVYQDLLTCISYQPWHKSP